MKADESWVGNDWAAMTRVPKMEVANVRPPVDSSGVLLPSESGEPEMLNMPPPPPMRAGMPAWELCPMAGTWDRLRALCRESVEVGLPRWAPGRPRMTALLPLGVETESVRVRPPLAVDPAGP